MNTLRCAITTLLPILLLAFTPVTQASSEKRLQQFERFAKAPIDQFTYFKLISFETLDDNTVAIWTGVNRVYLIKVREPCPNFNFADTLSLDNSQANVFSQRFDTIHFGHDRCMVASIRPVDYRAMRAAESADR